MNEKLHNLPTDMDNLLNKIKQEVKLADQEKHAIRAALIAHVKNFQPQSPTSRPSVSYRESSRWLTMQLLSYRAVALTLVVAILLLSSGVSYAAASAIPGELLYPVKRYVNERVKTALALAPDARAQVHAALAAERLKEAEKLVQRGALTAVSRAQLEDDFTDHVTRVKADTAELVATHQVDAAIEVSVALESTIDAHAQILATLDTSASTAVRPEIARLVRTVETTQVATRPKRDDSRAKFTTTTNVKKIAAAERNEAQEKLQVVKTKVRNVKQHIARAGEKNNRPVVASDVALKLLASDDAVVQGERNLEAGSSTAAVELAHEADRLAREAKVLVDISTELGLDTPVIAAVPTISATMLAQPAPGATSTMVGLSTASATTSTTTSPAPTIDSQKGERRRNRSLHIEINTD